MFDLLKHLALFHFQIYFRAAWIYGDFNVSESTFFVSLRVEVVNIEISNVFYLILDSSRYDPQLYVYISN